MSVGPLAQRRHVNPNHVEPEAQVGPEPPGRDLLFEAAVGRGDDPHVDAARQVLADAPHLAVLQHAQQLGLRARRQLPDFVEEQRAAIRLLEQPGPLGRRAGERAARVAEQLRLDQLVGQRRAVDRAEPPMRGAGRGGGWRARPAPCRCRSRRGSAPETAPAPRCGWRRRRSLADGLVPSSPPTLRQAGSAARGRPGRAGLPPAASAAAPHAAAARRDRPPRRLDHRQASAPIVSPP